MPGTQPTLTSSGPIPAPFTAVAQTLQAHGALSGATAVQTSNVVLDQYQNACAIIGNLDQIVEMGAGWTGPLTPYRGETVRTGMSGTGIAVQSGDTWIFSVTTTAGSYTMTVDSPGGIGSGFVGSALLVPTVADTTADMDIGVIGTPTPSGASVESVTGLSVVLSANATLTAISQPITFTSGTSQFKTTCATTNGSSTVTVTASTIATSWYFSDSLGLFPTGTTISSIINKSGTWVVTLSAAAESSATSDQIVFRDPATGSSFSTSPLTPFVVQGSNQIAIPSPYPGGVAATQPTPAVGLGNWIQAIVGSTVTLGQPAIASGSNMNSAATGWFNLASGLGYVP